MEVERAISQILTKTNFDISQGLLLFTFKELIASCMQIYMPSTQSNFWRCRRNSIYFSPVCILLLWPRIMNILLTGQCYNFIQPTITITRWAKRPINEQLLSSLFFSSFLGVTKQKIMSGRLFDYNFCLSSITLRDDGREQFVPVKLWKYIFTKILSICHIMSSWLDWRIYFWV